MKIFINDRPLKVKTITQPVDKKKFDLIISSSDVVDSSMFEGLLLINNATFSQIDAVIRIMEVKKLKKLNSITLVVDDKLATENYIKDHFKIIKAAGGLVKKGDLFLMINRLGVWDLPKGKLEKGETSEIGALREVEEECGIKVGMDTKICATWHTYLQRGKRILKKTDWYLMHCIDDANMAPQEEEDISEVKWMTEDELKLAIKDTYASIKDVIKKYKRLQKENSTE